MSPHSHPAHLHRPMEAVLFKMVSVFVFAAMTAMVKYLSEQFPIGQILFYRSLFALPPIILAALFTGGPKLLATNNLPSHALRSTAGATAMFSGFMAVSYIPLADYTALSFTTPMFIVVLAVLTLGEKVHAIRWSAVAAGFIGVAIMTGAHINVGGPGLIGTGFALLGASASAVAMIFLRRMSAHEHSITIAFYFTLTTLSIGTISLLWGWNPQDWRTTLMLAGMGTLGGVGQLSLSLSYRYGEASLVAPLDYVAMIWAVLFGYFFFGDLPGVSIWTGSAIVIAAGLLIVWRERRLKKLAALATTAPAL